MTNWARAIEIKFEHEEDLKAFQYRKPLKP